MALRVICFLLWIFLGIILFYSYQSGKNTCCSLESNPIEAIINPQDSFKQKIIKNYPITDIAIKNRGARNKPVDPIKNNKISENAEVEKESRKSEADISDVRRIKIERGIIFFPANSNSYISSETLEKFLEDVAIIAIENEYIIELIGHTNRLGSYEENNILAFERATSIKDKLINLHVPNNLIRVESRVWDEPLGSNKTKEGRKINRRVELFIKKTQ